MKKKTKKEQKILKRHYTNPAPQKISFKQKYRKWKNIQENVNEEMKFTRTKIKKKRKV